MLWLFLLFLLLGWEMGGVRGLCVWMWLGMVRKGEVVGLEGAFCGGWVWLVSWVWFGGGCDERKGKGERGVGRKEEGW